MANLVLATNRKSMPKLDGSTTDKIYGFFDSIRTEGVATKPDIERVADAADPRVRIGRVDPDHSAIMFRIDSRTGETTYIYLGTWPLEAAHILAEKSVLRVNPVNHVLEAILGGLDGTADRKKRSVVPDPTGRIGKLAEEPPAVSYLAEIGLTIGDLTDRLGLDPGVAEQAFAAPDDYVLNEIAAVADGWQGSALLELAVGTGIDTIRTKLGFSDAPVDDSLDEYDRILLAAQHPAAKMQFTFVGEDDSTEELRRVIEAGDFAAWRIYLHPEQRNFAEQDYSGPFRLSGGAGTGKTVVALHRVRNLARRDPTARIVLTTYNTALAAELHNSLRGLDPELPIAERPGEPGVFVTGIDRLANALLGRAGDLKPAFGTVFGSDDRRYTNKRTDTASAWRRALHTAGGGLDRRLATPAFFEEEYVSVILGNLVTTADQYVKAARPGRGVRLSRPQRIAVWKVVEAFRRQSHDDRTLSFPEVLAVAAEYLHNRAGFFADHVIIDEAQDLHATHWKLLRALVPEQPNDLFIAEDSHQRIYNQPVVLGRHGIKIVGRSRRLTLNYRTTRQNLEFAVRLLDGGDYQDLEHGPESTRDYRSARLGPEPRLIECASSAGEFEEIIALIGEWNGAGVELSAIAILTRNKTARDRLARLLDAHDIAAHTLDGSATVAPGRVQVLTMHRAKGMEFSRVILAGVDESQVPARAPLSDAPEEDRPDLLLRERSLLYVAASRARDELVVTWSGQRSTLLA
ncbi:3'-5' exonuclease [Nocardia sp. alder85J]|uniref:3'-5' exonuclease n=1 Tax=Nocardia sp. alder85J TaxID=2862949 RepID=UPI001CD5A08B|nr:3'-5' exonuclease [Nocardia sp. alder85J]MCX4092077.1 AAA family ATPase [Nocardia sp. alder85J]